jgi:hypothetical protein
MRVYTRNKTSKPINPVVPCTGKKHHQNHPLQGAEEQNLQLWQLTKSTQHTAKSPSRLNT